MRISWGQRKENNPSEKIKFKRKSRISVLFVTFAVLPARLPVQSSSEVKKIGVSLSLLQRAYSSRYFSLFLPQVGGFKGNQELNRDVVRHFPAEFV